MRALVYSPSSRLVAIVSAITVAIAAISFLPSVASTQVTYTIQESDEPDRRPAAALAGSVQRGNAHIFVPNYASIKKVVFYLDGTLFRTENRKSYDFNGTASTSLANPWDTTTVADGQHTVRAQITNTSGVVRRVRATFTVDNIPDTPPSEYSIQESDEADRSPNAALDGSTQNGISHVFTSPDTSDISRVAFYLDGAYQRTENDPPYDFAGGTTTLANGWDTKTVADGEHTIRAIITLTDGTTREVSVTFTVDNASEPPPPPPVSGCSTTGGGPDTSTWTSLERYNYDRRIKGLDRFFALDTKGVSHEAYIGETNTPNNLSGKHPGDVPQWNALLDKMLAELDRRCAIVSGWSVDETQQWGGYTLTTYTSGSDGTSSRAIDTPAEQAPVWERYVSNGKYGHNEAAGADDLEAGEYAGSPGTYGENGSYHYAGHHISPTTGMDTFQYMKSRGYEHVRLGFRWERVQPALGGPLDAAEMSRLKTSVADARAAGLIVVLDVHNYAWYKVSDTTYYKMGDGKLTGAHFADLWRRLSAEFKGDPGVYYDLMNEPGVQGDIPLNGFPTMAKAWEHYSQQAVDAIRANGDNKLIMVPTWRNSAKDAATYHPQGPWINDPANNHRYAFHMYFWINGWQGSGNYSLDYATENQYAADAGY